jgi:hypothetical protein
VGAISRSWLTTVALSPPDALMAVGPWLAQCGARVVRHDGVAVVATAGSETTIRLKGGWLSNASEFPVEITVQAWPVEGGTSIRIDVRDTWSFGGRVGMRTKYTNAIEGWVATACRPLAPYVNGPSGPGPST